MMSPRARARGCVNQHDHQAPEGRHEIAETDRCVAAVSVVSRSLLCSSLMAAVNTLVEHISDKHDAEFVCINLLVLQDTATVVQLSLIHI